MMHRHFYLFHNVEYCVTPSGVKEGLPWRGGPHGHPDGRLRLHHGVRAERAISRMLAEHVQAAQLLLPHLRSHWNPGEKLPRELPFRWESAASSHPVLNFHPFIPPTYFLSALLCTFTFLYLRSTHDFLKILLCILIFLLPFLHLNLPYKPCCYISILSWHVFILSSLLTCTTGLHCYITTLFIRLWNYFITHCLCPGDFHSYLYCIHYTFSHDTVYLYKSTYTKVNTQLLLFC